MKLPEEIVVDSFLPTFRYMLAKELEGKGLKEGRIAELMGISQAAVSKYRLNKTKREGVFLEDDSVKVVIKELAEGLIQGEISEFQAISMVLQLIRGHETRGLICSLHEMQVPTIRGVGCNLCVMPQGSEAIEEENVLSNLRAGLRLLESVIGFSKLIPNVGSNLAMAKHGAKDLTDVAAVPGRIYEMKGAVRIPAAPELNASRHVGSVVLAVFEKDRSYRAGINIRYSETIIHACEARGWSILEVKPEYETRDADLRRKLGNLHACPQVIFHRGGFGIEPIVYLMGKSAIEVVEMVRHLVQTLGAAVD